MEWRWNLIFHYYGLDPFSLNPCSNGMALEQ